MMASPQEELIVMSVGNPRTKTVWLLIWLAVVVVGGMFTLKLIDERSIEQQEISPINAGSIGEPRNDFLVEELEVKVNRTPSVSRGQGRDPLEATIDYTEHMETYEPPAPPTPTPAPVAEPADVPNVDTVSGDPTAEQWADLRECESGGNYQINTGNGYSGAYQFLDSTWQAYGGTGSAYQASPAEQDMRALMLYHASGSGPWPVCGAYLN